MEYGSAVTSSSSRATSIVPVSTSTNPSTRGCAQLAGDPEVGVELQVGELVVDDLEVLRLHLDVHGADRALVHGERAADGHHLLVLVDDPHLADRDGVGLQIDARVEAGVRGAEVGNRERAAADVDDAVEVRIVAGAGHLDVGLQRAGHVGHVRREALDDAEVDLAARDLQVDRLARPRAARAPRSPAGSRRNSDSGA